MRALTRICGAVDETRTPFHLVEKSRFSHAFSRSTLRIFFLGDSISIRNSTPCAHQSTNPAHLCRLSTMIPMSMISFPACVSFQIDARASMHCAHRASSPVLRLLMIKRSLKKACIAISVRSRSSEHIGGCEVDDLIAASVEHRLDHVETEPDHLIQLEGRRQGELLSVHQHFNEGRAVMLERLE